DRQAELLVHLHIGRSERFTILLIKHDVIGTCRQVKCGLRSRGHAMEETQKQPPLPPRLRRWLVRRQILHQNSNVADSTAKFLWKRIEFILDHLHELLSLHRSPADPSKGTLR